ncbi:MAG: class I SAM-dependent methyltransferase, partial [Dehalococcoidia bacterium]
MVKRIGVALVAYPIRRLRDGDDWLRRRMVGYWDTTDLNTAKFERVSVFHDIEQLSPTARDARWREVTESGMAKILERVESPAPDWSVLDIGCGVGRMLRPMSEQFEKVIGIDISPAMINFAREELADRPNVELHVGNGQDLSVIADNSIDLVYSVYAFQHFPRRSIVDNYLKETRRVLKPGGIAVIQTWNRPLTPIRRIKLLV